MPTKHYEEAIIRNKWLKEETSAKAEEEGEGALISAH